VKGIGKMIGTFTSGKTHTKAQRPDVQQAEARLKEVERRLKLLEAEAQIRARRPH